MDDHGLLARLGGRRPACGDDGDGTDDRYVGHDTQDNAARAALAPSTGFQQFAEHVGLRG
jgi:hypothetical protein